MNIHILCVGKIKEKFYRDAVAEYAKRLGRYCKFTVTEVADEKTPDGASPAQNAKIKETEGVRLLKHIRESDYVIALAIDGKEYSSEGFAKKLENLATYGHGSLSFVIGGSLGLSDDILTRADLAVSFSRMTFPHQLMRLILAEQIYRSFRIIHKEPYHK